MTTDRYTEQLLGLNEAALLIHAPGDLTARLQLITDKAREIVGAHQAVTSLTTGDDWSQSIHALSLSDRYAAWRDYDVPPAGEGIYRLVCERNTPFRLTQEELEAHAGWCGFGAEAGRHPPLRGWLAAPLVDRDGVNIGLVQLSDKVEGEFTERDEALLVQLARVAAIAIENSRLFDREQRRAADLREREEHFRQALESAETGTWELDVTTGREVWSEELYRLYGLEPGSVEASYEAWLELVHPDDRPRVDGETFAAAAAGRTRFTSEFRLARPDAAGRHRCMLSRGRVRFDDEGRVVGMSGTVVDISERKRIEAELARRARQQQVVSELGQRALAGAPLQEVMEEAVREIARNLDNDFCKVLELLPSGEALLLRAGVGWREGLVGKAVVGAEHGSHSGFTLLSHEPVVVEDLATESRFSNSELLREHGVVAGLSVIIEGDDGPWGVLGTHAARPHSYSPDDIHFVQAVANVLAESLARERNERALRAARDELEGRVEERTAQLRSSNRELETFAYSVSHDLRAPLRAIDGFSAALAEDLGDRLEGPAREHLERIRGAARRMGELIDDLLSLSRLSTSEMRKQDVDLSALVRRLAQAHCEAEPDRAVRLDIADGVVVRGDERLLAIALDNLLGNACKFSRHEDPACIAFGVVPGASPVTCFVRDNGTGFDLAYADKLFAPFQRLHSPAEFEGTGIGLATVQRVVHRHGGRIWAESEPGEGATFYFTLP